MLALFFLQVLVFLLTVVLYFYVGLQEGFVFTVFWFDILLHVLGGLWIALFSAWFFGMLEVKLSVRHIILLVLIAGASWELFEYVLGIGGSNFMSYQLDTAKDIVDDMLGGAMGAFIARRLTRATIE